MAVATLPRIDPVDNDLPARLRMTHLLMVEAVVSGEGLSRVSEIASEAMAGAPVVVVIPSHGIADGAPQADTRHHLEALRRDAAGRENSYGRPPVLMLEQPIASGSEIIGLVGVLASIGGRHLADA